MNPARLGWDMVNERSYPPYGGTMPKATLIEHHHMCPDGTPVTVTAQYIAAVGTTLYRWKVNGEPAGTTVAVGPATDPPDWSRVDSEHPVTPRSVA